MYIRGTTLYSTSLNLLQFCNECTVLSVLYISTRTNTNLLLKLHETILLIYLNVSKIRVAKW